MPTHAWVYLVSPPENMFPRIYSLQCSIIENIIIRRSMNKPGNNSVGHNIRLSHIDMYCCVTKYMLAYIIHICVI